MVVNYPCDLKIVFSHLYDYSEYQKDMYEFEKSLNEVNERLKNVYLEDLVNPHYEPCPQANVDKFLKSYNRIIKNCFKNNDDKEN